MRRRGLLAVLPALLTAIPAAAAPRPVTADWPAWSGRFLTAEGRVVDTGNGGVSHSEGQGYGMLLAQAAGDREAFARIWDWTRSALAIRDDGLLAWRYDPRDAATPVADPNSAADGDLLVAWALERASRAWTEPAHAKAARDLARAVRERLVFEHQGQVLLRPGPDGFTPPDGPVVNLSYWIFPALRDLARIDPAPAWDALRMSGLALLHDAARIGPSDLPPDWLQLAGRPRPAPGFPPVFGYNAVRIPLHLVWAGITDPALLEPYRRLWSNAEGPWAIDVSLGAGGGRKSTTSPGIAAVAALATGRAQRDLALPELGGETDYYAASLTLLARLALEEGRS